MHPIYSRAPFRLALCLIGLLLAARAIPSLVSGVVWFIVPQVQFFGTPTQWLWGRLFEIVPRWACVQLFVGVALFLYSGSFARLVLGASGRQAREDQTQ